MQSWYCEWIVNTLYCTYSATWWSLLLCVFFKSSLKIFSDMSSSCVISGVLSMLSCFHTVPLGDISTEVTTFILPFLRLYYFFRLCRFCPFAEFVPLRFRPFRIVIVFQTHGLFPHPNENLDNNCMQNFQTNRVTWILYDYLLDCVSRCVPAYNLQLQ